MQQERAPDRMTTKGIFRREYKCSSPCVYACVWCECATQKEKRTRSMLGWRTHFWHSGPPPLAGAGSRGSWSFPGQKSGAPGSNSGR